MFLNSGRATEKPHASGYSSGDFCLGHELVKSICSYFGMSEDCRTPEMCKFKSCRSARVEKVKYSLGGI